MYEYSLDQPLDVMERVTHTGQTSGRQKETFSLHRGWWGGRELLVKLPDGALVGPYMPLNKVTQLEQLKNTKLYQKFALKWGTRDIWSWLEQSMGQLNAELTGLRGMGWTWRCTSGYRCTGGESRTAGRWRGAQCILPKTPAMGAKESKMKHDNHTLDDA